MTSNVDPYSARPVGLMELNNHTREDVFTWFEGYDVSFKDPNEFCEKMAELRYQYVESDEGGESDPSYEKGKAGSLALWSILEDIADHSSHRHRRDALNIINEIKSREAGEDENVLIPEPMPIPYSGSGYDRLPTPYVLDDEVVTLMSIKDRMSERIPGDPLPIPVLKIPPPGPGLPPPAELPENDELINYLPAAESLHASAAARDQILINLSQGTLDPGLTPYTYRDDPAEKVLNMNNDIEFITAPTPEVNPRLLDSSTWPILDIYDNRLGKFGALKPTSYIYKLFEWCRLTIAQPGIARAYCIIFRANPRRYNEGSSDELEDEEPPSNEELECIIKFITHMAPSIWIFRNDVTFHNGALGYHRRTDVPHAIQINGSLFDAAEKAHREGHSPAHLLLVIWITFIHECGHYYNTLIHKATTDPDGLSSRSFSTPRKLRFFVSNNPSKEDRNFSTYDPWYITRGEMGEVIEWLIFGYFADTKPDGEYNHLVHVVGWGSYPGQMGEQIMFSSLIAEKLLRIPPMRFTCNQLRLFLQLVYAEALQQGNVGEDDMWEIMGHMNHYGAPIQQGHGPTQEDHDSDTEMTEVSGNEYSDDSEEEIECTDVDAALTGSNLGGGQDFTRYRRAVWRVKEEIDTASPAHSEGWIRDRLRPLGRLKRLNPPDLPSYIHPLNPRERWNIPAFDEQNVPSRLPDTLTPYMLLFWMVMLFVFGLWASWVLDEQRIYGSAESEAFWGWFVVLPLELLFLWVYIIPLRRLLKPWGTRRVTRRFLDW